MTDRTGADATPRLRKMRAIIAILASTPGHSVPRRELTALLWSDRGLEQARASLRQSIFALRAEVPALVEADGDRVWLVAGNVDLCTADGGQQTFAALVGVDPAFDRWLTERGPLDTLGAQAVALTADASGLSAPRRSSRGKMAAVAGALLLVVIMAFFLHRSAPPSVEGLTVIAIVPFAAVPPNAAAVPVAEGMSDDIRALIPADRAVVRVSDVAGDRFQRARALGAEWVISGSIEAKDTGGRVEVRVETIEGRQVWGLDVNASTGRLADAGAIAGTRIAMATGCALGGPRVRRNADVLALLFEACERLDFSGANYSHQNALVALQRLAEQAPGDALAQAYFGTALAVSADDVPPAIAKAQRIEAVRRLDRAQHLDPRVGEAWLGRYALVEDERALALKELLLARGLAVEPNNPMLNTFMAALLAGAGRSDEGLIFAQRAAALAPAYLATTQVTAGILSAAGRPNEALAILDLADRRFPRNPRQAKQRLDALLTNHDTAAARALLDRAGDIPGFFEPTRSAQIRRLTYAMEVPHGVRAAAVARDAIAEADANHDLAPRNFNVLTELDRTPEAFDLAVKYPLPSDVFFRLPARPVLMNPQFPVLARRIGLWDYWQHTGHWPDICRDRRLPWHCGAGVKSASIPG